MNASRTNTTIARTSKLALAGVLGLGSLVALATPALAETPANDGQEMVLVLPQPEPDTTDDLAAPQPEEDTTDDVVAPEPAPEPQPEGPGDIIDPNGHGDPEPNDDEIANPDPEDEDRPDDLVDGGCHLTHGCPQDNPDDLTNGDGGDDEECHPLMASCDITNGDPGEGGSDDSGDDDTQVESSGSSRGALPHTGAGIVLLAGVGSALTAVGAALRKTARR